ncbi:hypothetical protein ACLKA6_008691 [Drosophila palustris]
MVKIPTDGANGAGPSNPVFHPDLGVEGVILPPPITSEIQQSAKSAAVPPAGAGTVGEAPTASTKKKFSFTERRSAGDILQRHHNNAGSNRAGTSQETALPDVAPSAKKLRVQPGMSFAQMTKEKILIEDLDQGNLDGIISRSQFKWVETALAIRCFEMLMLEKKPGPPPVCKDIGWYQDTVKVIAFDDNRSAELYKAAVANLGEVYPAAKLVAVVWTRPVQPSMPTHDWRVAKIEEKPGPTHQAVLILNKESLAPIDAVGGELNFGFTSVFISVYKSDAPAVLFYSAWLEADQSWS